MDGPLGTELIRRGVAAPAPGWSAYALLTAPETVSAIHRDYAAAGATLHTADTFRTKRRVFPDRWEALAREAVRLARAAVPAGHRVAGSVAPLEDCYRPDLSPADPGPEHAELAAVLADEGVDILLCETFPHVGECLAAVEACAATGVETWAALTAGPEADLLTPTQIAAGAREAYQRGAAVVLVNCVPVGRTLEFLEPLAALGRPFGAYANAGHTHDGIGWEHQTAEGPERYAALAAQWVALGASAIGACCGTGPAHIAALAAMLAHRG